MKSSLRQTSFALCTAVAALLIAACPEPVSETRRETVDVPPGVEVDTAEDLRTIEAEQDFAGVLPTSFPAELPIYTPASLVDFGHDDAGSWVDLLTPHGTSRVRQELFAALEAKGFQSAAAADGAVVVTKGALRVRLTIEPDRPGTLYRYEY